jgi:hypothetical protein
LLSSPTVPQYSSSPRCASENPRRSSPNLSVRARRLRGDAGAHSSAHLRAPDRHAFHGHASLQTTRLTIAPREKTTAAQLVSTGSLEGSSARRSPQFLAESLLRFQRLEPQETNREAELHAHESREIRFGDRSQVVGLEQLPLLSVRGEKSLHAGSRTEIGFQGEKFKASHPSQKAKSGRMGHPEKLRPRVRSVKGWATRL